MTISKKLYLGVGWIVAILIVLFITNTIVVLKERSASRQATAGLESVQSLEAAQMKMMEVRLHLQDYLLTGDQRQREEMSIEGAALADLFTKGRTHAQTETLRDVLSRMEVIQRDWRDKFATPLINKRE